jgi:hypothetical protein
MTLSETGEAIWQAAPRTHMAMIRRALAKLDALAKVQDVARNNWSGHQLAATRRARPHQL